MTKSVKQSYALALIIFLGLFFSGYWANSTERSVEERSKSERTEIKKLRDTNISERQIARSVERLINGKPLGFGEKVGWAASIFNGEKFICGGTLIAPINQEDPQNRIFLVGDQNPKWLITAAHCFGKNAGELKELANWKIGAGSANLVDQETKLQNPLRIIRHDKFNATIFANDIALVRMEPSKNGQNIARSSIALVNDKTVSDVVKRYARISIYGWGATQFSNPDLNVKQLLRVDIPQVDKTDCLDAIDKSKNETVNNATREKIVCAGFSNGGTGICNGDSGSGAVYTPTGDENSAINETLLLGVTSWSLLCGLDDGFDVFTDIHSHLDWIWETITRVEKEISNNN